MWRGVGWQLVTEVSEQQVRSFYMDQAAQEERLALEDGSDNSAQDIGKKELFFMVGGGGKSEFWIWKG